jgi:hypothetical protein
LYGEFEVAVIGGRDGRDGGIAEVADGDGGFAGFSVGAEDGAGDGDSAAEAEDVGVVAELGEEGRVHVGMAVDVGLRVRK